MMNTPPNSNDLILAERYLNDELSPEETSVFEQRLSSDLVLQDTLADVVLIYHCLQDHSRKNQNGAVGLQSTPLSADLQRLSSTSSLPRHTTSLATVPPAHASRVIACATAALALAVLLVTNLLHPNPQRPDSRTMTSRPAQNHADVETAALWTMMASALDGMDVATHERDLEEPLLSGFSTTEIDVPDWMFAAVEATDQPAEMDLSKDGETL